MLCSDIAEIEQEKKFPFDEAGFDEMIKWLEMIYTNEKYSKRTLSAAYYIIS